MNIPALLASARAMLDGDDPDTAAIWPRGAAVLIREAIEKTCDAYWTTRLRTMVEATRHQQWLALPSFLGREPIVAEAEYAWIVLSNACHQRAYEIGLTEAELRQHLGTAERFRERIASAVRSPSLLPRGRLAGV